MPRPRGLGVAFFWPHSGHGHLQQQHEEDGPGPRPGGLKAGASAPTQEGDKVFGLGQKKHVPTTRAVAVRPFEVTTHPARMRVPILGQRDVPQACRRGLEGEE